jgi:hypothetical protein
MYVDCRNWMVEWSTGYCCHRHVPVTRSFMSSFVSFSLSGNSGRWILRDCYHIVERVLEFSNILDKTFYEHLSKMQIDQPN